MMCTPRDEVSGMNLPITAVMYHDSSPKVTRGALMATRR